MNAPAKPQVLTVSQLTEGIKSTLAESFSRVWVSGELSEVSRPSSGHVYCTLKDSTAQLRGVVWRTTAVRLGFEPREGQHVVCMGDVDVYALRGSYQLVIRQMEPLGIGSMQLAFQQMKDRLLAEGLFDARWKKPIPAFPKRIAFVTSPTGAAVRDFLQVASRRWRGIQLLVIPARVQGEGAAEEIVRGIQAAHNLPAPPDVLVVGRGGGSVEDLWCFNDEKVVRAIFASSIPVVSAVGHEIDITLSDLVADARALTPSEAAEKLVPQVDELTSALHKRGVRLATMIRRRILAARQHLDALAARRVFRKPFDFVSHRSQRLDDIATEFRVGIRRRTDQLRRRTTALATQLESLSPLRVLSRGYSVTRWNETLAVVRNAADVQMGELLRTQLEHGEVISRVESVSEPTTNQPSLPACRGGLRVT